MNNIAKLASIPIILALAIFAICRNTTTDIEVICAAIIMLAMASFVIIAFSPNFKDHESCKEENDEN